MKAICRIDKLQFVIKCYLSKEASESGDVENIMRKNITEFNEWLNRAKSRNAEIERVSEDRIVVVTKRRYFIADVEVTLGIADFKE